MPIPISDKFKPMGIGGFPLIDAEDVLMPDGTRLSDNLPVYVTEEEYALLVAEGKDNPNTPYYIYKQK